MPNYVDTSNIGGFHVMEMKLESILENAMGPSIMKAYPSLLYHLKNKIVADYVMIEKGELKPTAPDVIKSPQFADVNPGDLITARFLNRITHAIEDLYKRIGVLESGTSTNTSVLITSLSPTGALRLGDTLTVKGRNSEYTIGGHRVYIDNTRVKSFKIGSDDQNLIFEIPDEISNVTENGKSATLYVNNSSSTDSVNIILLPDQFPVQGNIEVGYQTVTPANIEAGKKVTFKYKANALTNQTTMFNISAKITGVPNTNVWEKDIKYLDNTGKPLPNAKIQLDPHVEKFFQIQIPKVPTSPADANFTLTVEASAQGVTGPPDVHTFKVGDINEQQDENIELSYFSAAPPSAYDNGKIKVSEGSFVKITFRAEFLKAGKYNISEKISAGNQWTFERYPANSHNSYTFSNDDIGDIAKRQKPLNYLLRAKTGASATGKLEIQIKRQGASKRKTIEMDFVKNS